MGRIGLLAIAWVLVAGATADVQAEPVTQQVATAGPASSMSAEFGRRSD